MVRFLVRQGHSLRCWYRPGSNRNGFGECAQSVDWLRGSLGDRAGSDELVRGVDAVVHAALEWEGPRHSQQRPTVDLEQFLEANLMGSLRLFQAARAAGVPRFIFISTGAVHEVILSHRPVD